MKDGRRTSRETGREPGQERSAARTLARVRKRDGREVPFDRTKIRDAIAAAMAAVGDDDPSFADEVSRVVELALADDVAQAGGVHVPAIEEIQDLVERALMDLGRAAVAKAYILYRDRRARLRSALRVHERVRGPLRVRESEGVSPWSKGRIVAALLDEAELTRPQAEEVAAAVERRVLASGWKRISTGLVRELVASELFERGWTHALRGHELVGLGRGDLRRLVEDGVLAPWEERERAPRGAESVLGGELLARWALSDVLSEEEGELHRAGDLFVEDLRACDRPLALAIEAALLVPGELGPPITPGTAGGASADLPWRLFPRLAEVLPGIGRLLVLEEPGPLLAGLDADGLRRWLDALGALARASGVRVDLSVRGARSAPGARAADGAAPEDLPGSLLAALAAPRAPSALRWAARLHLDGHALEQALARDPGRAPLFEALFAAGRLTSTWGDGQDPAGEGEERCVGPGLHRLGGERGAVSVLGAVALNLPRLARRAGAWREDLFQAGLVELVRAALGVGQSLARFQERSQAARRVGLRARPALALVPVGLREALFVLGDGQLDADQGARLLGLLADAALRFGAEGAVPLVLTPAFGERAARRFAWLDARRAAAEGGRQHWLFDHERAALAPAYSAGFALGSPAAGAAGAPGEPQPGRLEAEVLRTLRAGAFAPGREAGGAAGPSVPGAPEPHLAAWKRFELLRRSHAGEIELELFPPPRPRPPAGPEHPAPAPLRPLRL